MRVAVVGATGAVGTVMLAKLRERDFPGEIVPFASERSAGRELEGFALDLRSKAYAQLAPVPGAVGVEVVSPEGRALNHWNKAGKGALVRALAEAGAEADSADALAAWASTAGLPLERTDAGLRLTVQDPRAVPAR